MCDRSTVVSLVELCCIELSGPDSDCTGFTIQNNAKVAARLAEFLKRKAGYYWEQIDGPKTADLRRATSDSVYGMC